MIDLDKSSGWGVSPTTSSLVAPMPAARKDVCVGLGENAAGPALGWAVEEVTVTGGRLVVCHACAPQSAMAGRGPTVPIAVVEMAAPGLARAVTAARIRLGSDRVALRILPSRPEPLLLDEARRVGMLVLGPPGDPASGQRGTVHRLARRSPAPVVVVRQMARTSPAALAGHVVVGVDGSDGGRAALGFGFHWAAAHRKPLAAVHVGDAAQEDYWYDETTLSTHFAEEPPALRLLAADVEPWMRRYPQVPVKRASYAGPPLSGLLRAAQGAALLVAGERPRFAVGRSGPGAVIAGLLDGAECPLAVTPAGTVWA
jgi:nucleotide-binding universal stress UspA family protein